MKKATATSPFQNLKQVIQREAEELDTFPYPSKISFLPFYEHLKKITNQTGRIDTSFAKKILAELESKPELLESPDLSVITENLSLMANLMAGFFPSFFDQKQYGYVTAPFSKTPLFVSKHFQELMSKENIKVSPNIKEQEVYNRMVSNACTLILQKYYGQNFEPSFPTVLSVRNDDTQLERHLSVNIITDYVEIKAIKKPSKLNSDQLRELIQNPTSPQQWIKYLPPENFEFFGLLFVYFSDFTETEIVSRLKDKMLGKDPTPFLEDVEFVRHQVKSYFNNDKVDMGLKILDPSFITMIQNIYKISISALGQDVFQFQPETIAGSAYHKVWQKKEPLIIEDLKSYKHATIVEKSLIDKGVRSLLLYPSVHRDSRLDQIVELYSPSPKAFNYHSLVKLKVILPLIEAGLNKKREELENSIANIIQDQFTNIDPSVYWKFRKTALSQLKNMEGPNGHAEDMPEIVFKEVYPLYGQADIVASSIHRNKAIQADLIENLTLLNKTLKEISGYSKSHLLDYYSSKVDQLKKGILKGFSPSDETHILDLLKTDIHPCLRNLLIESPELKGGAIDKYFDQLNPHLGVIYHSRKKFEDSVAMLNSCISEIIQEADNTIQQQLPHYFEKYNTDGLEYNIYIGQSISQHKHFSKYHLKNFRLWQLITMCDVTRKIKILSPRLPLPLTTAQLIFVYSDPLDIRFRMDEKHFDVDGAYNIRYEIIKKRIDKAFIQGTKERLTQAGKIAIVYLHENNRVEYLDYLDYLHQEGYITSEIEELELGKLQGVEGLKALRVSVI